jgi:hypothetical protein
MCYLGRVLALCLVIFSGYSSAKSNGVISVGLFNEPEGARAGAEIVGTFKANHFGVKAGGVFYASENKDDQGYESNEAYGGFSLFGFVHANEDINPYFGLGVFAGRNIKCSSDDNYSDNYSDKCDKANEFAIYPEIGVEFNFEDFQITPYIRRYFDTSTSNKSGNVYGINVGIKF